MSLSYFPCYGVLLMEIAGRYSIEKWRNPLMFTITIQCVARNKIDRQRVLLVILALFRLSTSFLVRGPINQDL